MSLTPCSGRERQCVGERKIKTRVAQLFVTYCSGREKHCVGERKIKTRVAQLFVTYSLQW